MVILTYSQDKWQYNRYQLKSGLQISSLVQLTFLQVRDMLYIYCWTKSQVPKQWLIMH